jgi:Tfp pilus assembly protein PilE
MLKRVPGILISIIITACLVTISSPAFAQAQSATRVREVKASPAAEVTVTLNEQFFNQLLEAIFTRLNAPRYPLSLTRADRKDEERVAASLKVPSFSLSHASARMDSCESVVVLEREMGGVKTQVRFEKDRVVAPLAFRGNYNMAIIGCISFQGWADTYINLNFDREQQVLTARVTVSDIHLNNIPSLASGALVRMVQNSIDSRINPIEILQATQLSTRLPIAGSGGALRMRATEIRPEVVPGALSLHIFYEFAPAE